MSNIPTKLRYLQHVLRDIPRAPYDATDLPPLVLFMYHAEIPVETAREYLLKYVSKFE